MAQNQHNSNGSQQTHVGGGSVAGGERNSPPEKSSVANAYATEGQPSVAPMTAAHSAARIRPPRSGRIQTAVARAQSGKDRPGTASGLVGIGVNRMQSHVSVADIAFGKDRGDIN